MTSEAAAKRKTRTFVLALLMAIGLAYSAGLIWRSSFIVDGRRWFCLFDDALITMRYAENIARGHGPVWNVGERVEGVSTPLWTLLLVPVHWMGLSKSLNCLLVQLLGVACVLLCGGATWRLARSCRLSFAATAVACGSTVLAYNLQYFAVVGMETTLFAAVFTLLLAHEIRGGGETPQPKSRCWAPQSC